jgi:acyl carrier protein phosphodiesterase
MNYLAHAYLSFGHPLLLVGNMISDFVKGAKKNFFREEIRQGIMLHRAIDEFTDTHPATKEAIQIFRPHYRLYSGAIMDVLYDHYLANDPQHFTDDSLLRFSQETYAHLEQYSAELPPRFLFMLTYMKSDNWLYHYRFTHGMEKSLRGLVRRATYLEESDTAFALFLEHYDHLAACYGRFFGDVKEMAKREAGNLL